MQSSPSKFLTLSGAFAGVLSIVALALTSGEPSDESPTQQAIVNYFSDHKTAEYITGFLLIPLIVLFLLFFTSALRAVLRSGEASESTWSTVVGASLPLVAFSIALMGSAGMAVTEAVDSGQFAIAHTIALASGFDWIPWAAPAAATMLATGIGTLKTATLPKPFAIVSIVLGIVAISPLGFFAFLAMPLWLIAASATILRQDATATAGVSAQPLAA